MSPVPARPIFLTQHLTKNMAHWVPGSMLNFICKMRKQISNTTIRTGIDAPEYKNPAHDFGSNNEQVKAARQKRQIVFGIRWQNSKQKDPAAPKGR